MGKRLKGGGGEQLQVELSGKGTSACETQGLEGLDGWPDWGDWHAMCLIAAPRSMDGCGVYARAVRSCLYSVHKVFCTARGFHEVYFRRMDGVM